MEAYAGKQFVGIDLHRRRSVIVRTTEAGEVLEAVRIVNDVQRMASVMTPALFGLSQTSSLSSALRGTSP